MKYARLAEGFALEVFTPPEGFALADCFHADVAAQFVECPPETAAGSTLAAGVWTHPAPAAPAAPAPTLRPLLSPMAFYLAFTPAERIAIKTSADPVVAEFWATFQLAVQTNTSIDPNLSSVAEGVAYLHARGILASDERVAQVLNGTPQ